MASQLSNERTLVMLDAVGAGLVECIRLAQSDIEESQEALKVNSIQCNCSRHNNNNNNNTNINKQQPVTATLASLNRHNSNNYGPYRSITIATPDYDDMDTITTTPTTTSPSIASTSTNHNSSNNNNRKRDHQMIRHSVTPPSLYDQQSSEHSSSLMRYYPHHNNNNNNINNINNNDQLSHEYCQHDNCQLNHHQQQQQQQQQIHLQQRRQYYHGDIVEPLDHQHNYFPYDHYDYQQQQQHQSVCQSRMDGDLKNSFSSSSTSASGTNSNNCSATSMMMINECSRKSKSFNRYLINNNNNNNNIDDHHAIAAQRKPSILSRKSTNTATTQKTTKTKHNDQLNNYNSMSSNKSHHTCHLEQQTKIAYKYAQQLENQLMRLHDLRDSYLLHLKMGQNVRTISRAYALSSASLSSASLGKLTSSRSHLASALSNGTINSKIAKASIKEFMETIDKIELELESLMGTFMLQIKSIQGFARICTGDVFEITIKYGDNQKFKTKIRVLKGDKQKCDHKEAIFRARINDVLSVKASECKGLGKKVLLGNKLCETKDLFTAHSQLMTISLNQTGSIKLNLVVTWNPLDLSTNTICDANIHHMLNFFGDINK